MNLMKFPKWQKFIFNMKDDMLFKNLSITCKMTYSHLSNIKKELAKRNIIIVTRKGREDTIRFTEKGLIIKNHVDNLYSIIISK